MNVYCIRSKSDFMKRDNYKFRSDSKLRNGTWSDASADGTGTAGYFRLYASDGTTCGLQGTITGTGGG